MNTLSENSFEYLKILVPALTGLLGVTVGIIITAVSNWKLKSKETKLRLLEKTFERRIKAHEDILSLSELMRTTVATDIIEKNNFLVTYPGILHNNEYFENFLGKFYDLVNRNTHWINIELFREINYIQDYFATLTIQIKGKDDRVFPEIAKLIKDDIIQLAANLEKEAVKFFKDDLPKLKSLSNMGHHKYDLNITELRLKNTLLYKNLATIKSM